MFCDGDLKHSRIEPVLFIHGTSGDANSSFAWNWFPAFRARHWAYCAVNLPQDANADIQLSAQYVVWAIRLTHRWSGRKIGIVGVSQGGMIGRWAFKYWPDTRVMVSDYVGLASSNHGTLAFNALCKVTCSAADWQQSQGSNFLTALNTGPQTWPGISYTEVATETDDLILPYTSVFLPPAPNVTNTTIQAICPVAVAEHNTITASMAGWLIGVDALTHPGPGNVARINRAECSRILMPGVTPTTLLGPGASALASLVEAEATAKTLKAEPPLAPYAR